MRTIENKAAGKTPAPLKVIRVEKDFRLPGTDTIIEEGDELAIYPAGTVFEPEMSEPTAEVPAEAAILSADEYIASQKALGIDPGTIIDGLTLTLGLSPEEAAEAYDNYVMMFGEKKKKGKK
jgi:hypothetical protein